MGNYKEKLKSITTFIFDFDGVMSDGKVWVLDEENQIRNANVKDGYAIHNAVQKGYRVVVISGGNSNSIPSRMHYLGVTDVFTQVRYKKDCFETYLKEHHLNPEEVLYMGDDIPDYEIMQMAGVACCPADAAIEIQEVADYISIKKGGDGCVRDVIEQVMRLHGKWFDADSFRW